MDPIVTFVTKMLIICRVYSNETAANASSKATNIDQSAV
jgi:hypothetical protein